MSLEHFKKQVLLLHSEQSTLDSLSSGFNDRYTVHCATSGTEALNTLGETQIDVIVSAQDLPGMSGLDALREAKKRSPETIGILLAGNEDDGLEALVGDQEVFQIVRGSVTPDSLKSLIDNATRQARLLALADSANDTTASPDEPVAEHIVMETSENGATIISDGTASLPVLDPKKVSAADVGSRGVDVLVMTQDEEFLATVRESARGLHNVIYANTLAQADDAVSKEKVGVAVVDAAMVGSNVEKLTMHLRTKSPRLVAIVAGRRDDGEMLMDLINRGKVYRFLLKPVSPGRSRLAIEASVKHHLEAPDSAFKISGPAAPPPEIDAPPKAQPKPKAAAKPKAAPKPKAKPKAKAKKQPAKPAPAEKAKPVPNRKSAAEPPLVAKRDQALTPMDDGFTDAFGGDEPGFTETMTGIVKSIGDSISNKRKKPTPAKTDTPIAAGDGGSLLQNPKMLGLGAAAVIVLVGLSFWLFGGSDDSVSEEPPVAATPDAAERAPVADRRSSRRPSGSLDDLIDEAQFAAESGRVYNPPGNNAIEFYVAALAATPGDPVAAAGLEDAIAQALGMAESALLERRPDEAAAALQRVEFADPDNARLPFLNAQLAQIQLRSYLDEARLAMSDSRFEDARAAIDRARALSLPDVTEIDAIADELSAALSDQRVDEVLAQANARLEQGRLIEPANDNARYYYELALSNDPGNALARQGLTAVASKLVLQARARIDAGDFLAADGLLADARSVDASNGELAAATAALAAARNQQARQEREAEQRAAAEQAAAERAAAERAAAERAAAERAAAERAAAERAAAERAAAEQAAAEKLAAEKAAAEKLAAEQAAAEKLAAEKAAAEKLAAEEAAAERLAAEQAAAEKAAAEKAAAEKAAAERAAALQAAALQQTASAPVQNAPPPAAAAARPAQQQNAVPPPLSSPVSVSSLKRTKYVAPKYPRAAQRRSLSGWVDVVFTVDIDGTVTDVTVRDSNPGDTFVNSAKTAVEDWEFEPVIEDGVAVQRRAAVRMMFAIE